MTATLYTLISFIGSDGSEPYSGLIADANGDLFGTTVNGGANGDGTVFEIVNNGTLAAPSYESTPTTLVSFNGSNGAGPFGGLIANANGDLFGTTGDTVFEVANNGTLAAPSYASTLTTLVSGPGSFGGLIADTNGDLFGTMGSTVFEVANNGTLAAPSYASTPKTLASFNDVSSGFDPWGSLIADANGDLFGTTAGGGAYYNSSAGVGGTVFEIVNSGTLAAPSYASTPTTLVSFNGNDGTYPYSSLIADANGDAA